MALDDELRRLKERVAALEQWKRERDATDARARDELRHDFEGMFRGAQGVMEQMLEDAVIAAVTRTKEEITPILQAELRQIPGLSRDDIAIIRDARDELARARVRAEEEQKREARAKSERDEAKYATDVRLRRWQIYAAILVPIIAGLAGLAGAAAGSHSHKEDTSWQKHP